LFWGQQRFLGLFSATSLCASFTLLNFLFRGFAVLPIYSGSRAACSPLAANPHRSPLSPNLSPSFFFGPLANPPLFRFCHADLPNFRRTGQRAALVPGAFHFLDPPFIQERFDRYLSFSFLSRRRVFSSFDPGFKVLIELF